MRERCVHNQMEPMALMGVKLSPLTFDSLFLAIDASIQSGQGAYACAVCASSLVEASRDSAFQDALNDADISFPDGAPVAWAVRWMSGFPQQRMSGPSTMLEVVRHAASKRYRVLLYGSRPDVLETLEGKMRTDAPRLMLTESISPPFRPLNETEDAEMCRRIQQLKPDIIFVGLGAPKQEKWMREHRDKLGCFIDRSGRRVRIQRWNDQAAPPMDAALWLGVVLQASAAARAGWRTDGDNAAAVCLANAGGSYAGPRMSAASEGRTGSVTILGRYPAVTPQQLRLLVLLAHPGIQGPLPKLGPLLVDGLCENGCQVTTASWSRRREGESAAEKVLGRLQDLWAVWMECRRGHYDALLVSTTHEWRNTLRDVPLLFVTRTHIGTRVLLFHGSFAQELDEPGHVMLKSATRMLMRWASLVLVLSREELQAWKRFSPSTPVQLVRNPFRPVSTLRDAISRTKDCSAPFKYLFVGRLHLDKGVRELVAAYACVSAAVDAELHIAGVGPERARMQKAVDALGLTEQVTFHEYLPLDELYGLYRQCDALVLPSYREGFPTVLFEAMDCRLPIVCSDIRGARDCLIPDRDALLVPPRAVGDLAESMMRVAQESRLAGNDERALLEEARRL